MFDPTPWMIRGAMHSARVGRSLAYAAVGGAEGITSPGGLKVTALPTPGAEVNIAKGSGTVLGRYGGQFDEMYVARNPATHKRAIAPNQTAASRYDLVIVRIKDPEFEKIPDLVDPHNYQYVYTDVIQNVAANTTKIDQIAGINYPAYPLARIHMPAGATQVAASQITDLRRLAQSRSRRELAAGTAPGGLTTGNVWGNFPGWNPTVEVPDWATHAYLILTVEGLTHVGGIAAGELAVQFEGADWSAPAIFDLDAASTERTSLTVAFYGDVRAIAGQTVKMQGRARRTYTESDAGYLATRTASRVTYDAFFVERVV